MSKLLQNFIGIDISKRSFDLALLKADKPDQILHMQFEQSIQGFKQMQDWLKLQGVSCEEQTLFCMEYTGVYNTSLVDYLVNKKALIWVEMAIRIKRSEGFERSSNDKTDSIKIARYAYRFQDRKQLWSPVDERLAKIKHLIAQRDRTVTTISMLSVPVNEIKATGQVAFANTMDKIQRTAVRNLRNTKDKIEAEIMKIVNEDKELSQKVKQVTSIKGIGELTAVTCLVYTKGFTCFETGKQMSCYCGVVPFTRKQSGTSVKSKPRVSPFANKKLKTLLHLCALSAIRYDTELKAYFDRKVAEGKNKMSVINAVRNKLILRMFAVLRDDRNYVDNYVRKCA